MKARLLKSLFDDDSSRVTMSITWKNIFDNYGIKKVTKTDSAKSAYLPNIAQRTAIEAAGIAPGSSRPAPTFDVVVLFDSAVETVKASYYYSERSANAERSPEPRMGHEIISAWLNQGDHVVIGNVGTQVFAIKLQGTAASDEDVMTEVVRRADSQTVYDRAKQAKGKPARKTVQHDDFVRNPYVVAATVLRSNGKCEMPGCARTLFIRDNGTSYLEVHHVVPLAEHGDDTLANAAALCPHCHRELHSGKNRKDRRKILAAHIATLPV
jgi:5-methylcytosine-specific restriction endonuclease McrA